MHSAALTLGRLQQASCVCVCVMRNTEDLGEGDLQAVLLAFLLNGNRLKVNPGGFPL